MVRAMVVTATSLALTTAVVAHAYYLKHQFYPTVVYLTKSSPSMAVLYIQAFVLVFLLGKFMRKVFFGQLRAAEMEVGGLSLRSDHILSLMALLATLDFVFVTHACHSIMTRGASVQLVFGFEYAILMTMVLTTFIKYFLHTLDLQNDNPWENKAVYMLYTELFTGFIKVLLYMAFMTIMIKVHTFPLFAIRPMYLAMRYPDATPEELQAMDNVCIICREEMLMGAKRLPCNHIFHSSCLRSWFQRQQTCPTCRMDVLRAALPNQTQAPPPAQQPAPPPPQHQPAPPPANMPQGMMPPFPPGMFPFWGPFPAAAPPAGPPNAAQTPPETTQPSGAAPAVPSTSRPDQTGQEAPPSGPIPAFPFSFPPPFPSAPWMGMPPPPPFGGELEGAVGFSPPPPDSTTVGAEEEEEEEGEEEGVPSTAELRRRRLRKLETTAPPAEH
ncbi:UNVERIFIED_CONTAM: hypothetical protein FKN15_011318 [Acipenser sinensis]